MTIHRLTGFDASLLALEAPSQPMTGAGLWDLDISTVPEGYSFENFHDRLAERLVALPELRMKLADPPFNLDNPVWVDDPDFDLNRHLHRVELPAPGGNRELADLVGQLMAGKLDRSGPMWDMWVIEGLSGANPRFAGPVAVMHRMHHVLGDGVTAMDVLARLSSSEADPPAAPARDGIGAVSERQIVLDSVLSFARRPWYLFSKVLPASIAGVVKARRRKATKAVFDAPRTLFNGSISDRRSVAYVRLNLKDVKTVKDRFGVSVNDVTAAVVAGAVRQFLIDRAALPADPVVAAMPISIYAAEREGRNQLSSMDVSLCTGLSDPADRLKAVAEASWAAKERISALGPTLLQDWMQVAPGLLALMARLYRRSGQATRRPRYNLTVSNVKGPREQIYLFGSAVRARYPFGPVFDGSGLNVTVMSLQDGLDFGLVACPDIMPDLWQFADGLPAALEELLHAAT